MGWNGGYGCRKIIGNGLDWLQTIDTLKHT
jgi:hypothetical protein